RQYWLLNLYRNPVAVLQVIGQVGFFLVRHFPDLLASIPQVLSFASSWWPPITLLFLGASILIIQYRLLNPRRQFLPPRLSIRGLHTLITSIARDIPSTPGEMGFGGALALALIGTIILPGLGTLIGGALGSLLGFAGQSLGETKHKVWRDISAEL